MHKPRCPSIAVKVPSAPTLMSPIISSTLIMGAWLQPGGGSPAYASMGALPRVIPDEVRSPQSAQLWRKLFGSSRAKAAGKTPGVAALRLKRRKTMCFFVRLFRLASWVRSG